MKNIIYFDHAATSYPKPHTVIDAVAKAFEEKGGNPGRSGHKLSLAAAEGIYECRESISELFSFTHPERVVFTLNATHALNMSIKGLAQNNSHILTSNLEHNSVIRPLYDLMRQQNKNIQYSTFHAACDNDSEIIRNFTDALRNNTKMVVITLASNICGKIMPIAEIGRICHDRGITIIGDGAQIAGVMPLDFEKLNLDVLCLPGHKGLYGPQGTGVMLIGEGIEPESIIQGGNGVNSKDPEMNGELPERLEAGTVNTVGICGLNAGIKYVKGIGIDNIYRQSSELCAYLTHELKNMPGIHLYGDYARKVPVVLFNKDGSEPETIAEHLDEKGICVRSGLHCAPIAHIALKSSPSGAVRVSLSHNNTFNEVDNFLKVISKI